MVEKPDELEFLKRSYLRHLETGESPSLVDLLDKAPPAFSDRFQDFVITHYFETGEIGDYSYGNVNLREILDRAVNTVNSLSPSKLRRIFNPSKPRLRIVKPKE